MVKHKKGNLWTPGLHIQGQWLFIIIILNNVYKELIKFLSTSLPFLMSSILNNLFQGKNDVTKTFQEDYTFNIK